MITVHVQTYARSATISAAHSATLALPLLGSLGWPGGERNAWLRARTGGPPVWLIRQRSLDKQQNECRDDSGSSQPPHTSAHVPRYTHRWRRNAVGVPAKRGAL
eukprot:SAG11_NODE_4761_length_1777_cov_1.262217_2_plen_104_part_00